jgi:glycosyltransferase involved in cell wall biosynthesis
MRGVVPDIAPELAAASVMAVPLTVGSGTRYKLLEAFASGLPVVTSRVGAEGLLVRDGVHALLAESPSEVASAIVRVWTEPDLTAGLASAAHDLVRRHYSYSVSGAAVAASVNRLARIDRTRSTS